MSGIFRRVVFTFGILIFYRLGTYVPIPYLESAVVGAASDKFSGGFMAAFNLFSGGALSRMAVFSLNVMPYIVASIVNQLLNTANDSKKNASSKTKVRYIALALSVLHAIMLVGHFTSGVASVSLFYYFGSVLTLVAGAMLLMWLGELIMSVGIGNGVSLIIFAGIVSELPPSISKVFGLVSAGAVSVEILIFSLVFMLFMIYLIVLFECSYRNITVLYPRRQFTVMGGENKTHMPFKINMSGVISPIFANAVMIIPVTGMSFFAKNDGSGLIVSIFSHIMPGTVWYNLLYSALVIFFCFFYTLLVLNPNDSAENLRKSGGVLIGRRPGKDTADYIRSVVINLTVWGALYITFVCVVTEIVKNNYLPSFVISGTSLLIVVGVIMDTISQIQTHVFSGQYSKVLKKTGLRKR